MVSSQKEQLLCILFSDLKGYSGLKDDRLKNQIVDEMKSIFERVSQPGVELIKTMGDGLMVASHVPLPLAETALYLCDNFRNTDWKSKGYPDDFLIRIGLHLDEMIVHFNSDGSINDAIGTGVDTTARIEPVTSPNAVFCSKRFFELLQDRGASKIKGINRGKMQLAKNYGEMELFEIRWLHDVSDIVAPNPVAPATSSIPMPNIKKPFTDKDRKEFLRASFSAIQKYFEVAVKQLEATVAGTEASINTVNDTKFVCEIYLNGQLKTRGKIWIGSLMKSSYEQIQFSEGRFDINDDNSYNDAITIEEKGQEAALRASFGSMFAQRGPDVTKPSSPEQIAEYLWLRLTRSLEY